jgi:hypothetical protein
MRNCIYEQTLQAWFDGELPADQSANVAAHLNVCAQCAEAARQVEAENLIAAKGLGIEFAAAIPTDRLRQRIETAIAATDDASVPTIRQSRWHAAREFFASFRPLAYAAIAAAVLLAGFVGFVYLRKDRAIPVKVQNDSPAQVAANPQKLGEQPPKPAPPLSRNTRTVRGSKRTNRSPVNESDVTSLSWQERQYDYAIAKLNDAIKIQPPLRPSLEVEYQYNLALVDNVIQSSREVAHRNPKDLQAAQSMLAAYQSKVDLMNQIANAREPE